MFVTLTCRASRIVGIWGRQCPPVAASIFRLDPAMTLKDLWLIIAIAALMMLFWGAFLILG